MAKSKNRHRRALIVTLVGYHNFGNSLQNYALSQVLRKIGFKVKTANYFSLKHKFYNFLSLRLHLLSPKGENVRLYNFSKHKIRNDYIRDGSAQLIVVGSDQVWNPDYLNKNDLPLNTVDTTKKTISYAASIGKGSLSEREVSLFKKYLHFYSSISVREMSAKRLLSDKLGLDAKLVLDPTLLLDKASWNKVANSANSAILPNNKYVLSYVLGKNTDMSQAISYAKSRGYDYISFSDNEKNTFGVEEFLHLIRDAELVCTDSYHACIFSYLFNKPFIVYKRDNNEELYSRITSLFALFEIQGHEGNKSAITDNMLLHDYTKSYKRLEKLRDESYEYIRKAVRG